jgi:hypothetical protein
MMAGRISLVSTTVLVVLAAFTATARAQGVGQPLIGLVQGANALVRFSTAAPVTVGAPVLVTGLGANALKAIDYRPATGQLYGIATDVAGAAVQTYVINPVTGAATAVGTAVTLPVPGASWDLNFNPVVDRLRIVNDQDENARLNPDTGALAGDDTNLTPAPATVGAVAYLNPFAGATATTLYAINQTTSSLALIGGVNAVPSPNGGVVTDIGPLGVAINGGTSALDIANNNAAFAVLRPAAGSTSLYAVNLATGAATAIGTVGDGSLVIDDIAVIDPGLTISPPTGTYTSRQGFDIVLLADTQGRSLASGSVLFNGQDVTGVIASCVRTGITQTGTSFRCPNIGGVVTGPGTHTFSVRLVLGDGTFVQRAVTWTVLPVVEP